MQRAGARFVRAIFLASILTACSGANGAEPRPLPETQPAPEAPEPSEPAEVELDPSSPCGRALACCHAYASAIPDVVEDSACRGPGEAHALADADRRCRGMSAGWREALERLGQPTDSCE